ncbi:MAG: tetratricopeptide repeat protein, partial [Marinomonas sp.]
DVVQQGLAQFPQDPQLITLDAQRLLFSAKPQEAAERLSPVLNAEPIVAEAHMLAGQMLLQERSPAKAKAHFEKVLSAQPAQQTAMLALAAIARDAGDEKEAARWINETNKYGKPQPVGLLFAAQMAYDAGDIARANELLEKFPPELARLPQYQRLTGFVAAARGQRKVAVNALLRYTESVDGDVLARRILAQNLAANKEYGKAWDAVSPVLDHPQADGATLLLGLRLAEETGRGDTVRIKQKIAERGNAPSLAKPMRAAGQAIRAGDWAKAEGIYAPLTTGAGQNDPMLLNNAAAVKSKLGKHDEAVTLARRALENAPQSPEIMDTLGWAIWQSGSSPDEARALLTKAREAAPKNREIANHWAIAQAQK